MTPEKLLKELQRACPQGLISVILYGSAAAGDHVEKSSDYNVLIVVDTLDVEVLMALTKPSLAWSKAGNPTPLLFTKDQLAQSTDVFPIELLDIKETHKVLYGSDLVKDLEIDTKNLRLELEHELRGKLIRLRQSFLLTQGKPKAVVNLMTQSLSTFLVLFRAALRLFDSNVPQQKMDALVQLEKHLSFDPSVFQTVQSLKDGSKNAKEVVVDDLFNNYLKTIESVVDAVDAYIQKENK